MATENINTLEFELVEHWNSLEYKPSLIVIDLDHTLWPYNVMKKRIAIAVELKDRLAFTYSHSKDVTLILKTLKEKCR